MDIEQRLEKLAERTEAMAHSVELLAGMQIETERRMAQLVDVVNQIGMATEQLMGVAHDHEQRIIALEG